MRGLQGLRDMRKKLWLYFYEIRIVFLRITSRISTKYFAIVCLKTSIVEHGLPSSCSGRISTNYVTYFYEILRSFGLGTIPRSLDSYQLVVDVFLRIT